MPAVDGLHRSRWSACAPKQTATVSLRAVAVACGLTLCNGVYPAVAVGRAAPSEQDLASVRFYRRAAHPAATDEILDREVSNIAGAEPSTGTWEDVTMPTAVARGGAPATFTTHADDGLRASLAALSTSWEPGGSTRFPSLAGVVGPRRATEPVVVDGYRSAPHLGKDSAVARRR